MSAQKETHHVKVYNTLEEVDGINMFTENELVAQLNPCLKPYTVVELNVALTSTTLAHNAYTALLNMVVDQWFDRMIDASGKRRPNMKAFKNRMIAASGINLAICLRRFKCKGPWDCNLIQKHLKLKYDEMANNANR
jgi:hypothetical protein